jgi:hypothetical protein
VKPHRFGVHALGRRRLGTRDGQLPRCLALLGVVVG